MNELVIVIPWVPDQECNPNNHSVSERTRIRHRKEGATAAGYPMKAAFNTYMTGVALNRPYDTLPFYVFAGPVVLDITVKWGFRQKSWDDDNLVTAYKYVRDALQTYGIVKDDKDVRIGVIRQERADAWPETVLTLRAEDEADEVN